MSNLNNITRWSNLSRMAGGRLPQLTIAAPFVAFIILHNEPLQPFLELSDNRHPNAIVQKLALARFDIFYIGLVIVGFAVGIFALFSPTQITSYDGYDNFIKVKERTKTANGIAGSLRLTLEGFARFSKDMSLSFDARERRMRYPRRFREGLQSLLRSISKQSGDTQSAISEKLERELSEIVSDLSADEAGATPTWDAVQDLLPQFSIDVFRLEYISADYSAPIHRAAVFWLLLIGTFVALLPTLITTYLVLADLFEVAVLAAEQELSSD